jgi:hypothetical protein
MVIGIRKKEREELEKKQPLEVEERPLWTLKRKESRVEIRYTPATLLTLTNEKRISRPTICTLRIELFVMQILYSLSEIKQMRKGSDSLFEKPI